MSATVGSSSRRQAVALITVLALMAAFAIRLVWIQGVTGPATAADALASRLQHVELPAARGDIVDANGQVLATSVQRYRVVVDQRQIPDYVREDADGKILGRGAPAAAAVLAPLLKVSVPEAQKSLTGTAGYAVVAAEVTPQTWASIKDARINGISAEEYYKREYPAGTTAGNIIGYGYEDGSSSGQMKWTGIEGSENSLLAGKNGSQVVEQGLGGQQIPGGESIIDPAVPGDTVALTIDQDIQWKAQQAINDQVKNVKATWGTVVVSNVKTGEIVAMADSGSLDPANPSATPAADRGSRAVEAVFEPGSTAKVISMCAAIDNGIATPTSQYQVPYTYTTSNGEKFKDHAYHPVENWTLTGILAQSSNVGTVMVDQKLPKQVRYDYLSKFGFGKKTGVELQAESPGILHPADQWDGRTQYTVLFGQGVSVNALQATGVYATLANGGVSMPMHLVKGYTDANGVYHPKDVGKGTRVVSPSTASQVLGMMESVVDDGTGASASIPGYRVAGKTGTAEVAGPTGQLTSLVTSFIGVAPADNPQYAVSVIMMDPTTTREGATTAAPVFKDVMSFTLQSQGVPLSTGVAKPPATTW